MALIAGASQFLTASTLSNTQNRPAVQDGLISGLGEISLLDIARGNRVKGIGLSSAARQLNADFIKKSQGFNVLFSAGIGPGVTIEGAQKQILALRSSLSADQVARFLLEDDGSVSKDIAKGTQVDTQA